MKTSMHISMPENLRAYLNKRTKESGFDSASEYIRDLIRADQRHYIAQANEQFDRRIRYESQMRNGQR